MKIYIAHPSSIPFRKRIYEPVRESLISENHKIVLPHESSGELFDSKSYLQNDCDLLIAIVSESSTGVGIELGWADSFDVSIVCLYKKGTNPSSSIDRVASSAYEYKDGRDLIGTLDDKIEQHNNH